VSNPSGSSLFCNPSNVIAGDTSRYLFADGVHPTPYGHKLFAQFVNKELVLAGWL
jgi:phospholipase/lecithinase/hemolysin